MSKRIKKKAVPGADYTRDDATALAAAIVASQIQRERLVAERDEAMETAAKPYRPQIDQIDAELKDGLARLEAWATAHRAEFGEAKSLVLPGGNRVGWRLGNWSAKAMKGHTWKTITEALRALPPKWKAYTREKVTINKTKIVADREIYDWSSIGVDFTQGENFYLEPHREAE